MEFDQYFSSGIKTINKAITDVFEKADLRILVFIILCLNYLSFTLSSNEEAYLPLAKQFMDHSWMPDSFIFNEWPGNRLIFQYITGFFLRHFEFESFIFFARIAVFLLISIPVGAIFKKLEVRNIYVVLAFQLYLLHQNYFAQEFIFGDYEAKSIAYIFVLAGVYYLLNNKYLLAVVFTAVASYFHILVGGWFFVLLFIFSFFSTKSFGLIIKEGLLFILLMLPFGFYLGAEIFKSGSVINGVNIDWVYVYFRNAHHTAPLSMKERLPVVIPQVIITGLLFLSTLFIFRKFKGELINKLYTLNVIVFSMLFVSLGISLVDKTGVILKFYLFRIAALGCFLMYLYIISLMELIPKTPPLVKTIGFITGFYLILAATAYTFQQTFYQDPKCEFRELVNYVKNNTNQGDVFLNLGDLDISFSRITRRDEFVLMKFDPGGGQKIYEWYTRIKIRNALWDDLSQIQNLKQKYRLHYFLTDHPVEERNSLKLIFQNKAYCLYKIL
jgi:hypothetical protein